MTKMPIPKKAVFAFIATFGLAGCVQMPMSGPAQAPDAIIPVGQIIEPRVGIAGLTTREPTLFCKAETYSGYIGQPGNVIPTLGITRAYRVVEFRGLNPQDYDPNRILFNLDAMGNISKVDCG